jgi:malonate transporter and related proteins
VQAILNVAFPIFGVILAGFLAGRWRILGPEATTALNAFVSFFALPVLFFGTLARTPVAAVLDPSLMAGFSIAAFGEQGLPPAMLTVIVTAVVSMVFGVMLIELEVAAGHGPVRTFLRAAFNVARNPLPVSIALGIAASWIGLPIPVPVEKWLDLMGAAAAPCALFAIGLFLSDKSIKSGLAEAGLATLIKLLLQPLAALLILPFFVPIDSIAGKVALLMASLPTAANAFVLAKQFDVSVEQNTASVLLSTAFSVVTVSALLVWLRVT